LNNIVYNAFTSLCKLAQTVLCLALQWLTSEIRSNSFVPTKEVFVSSEFGFLSEELFDKIQNTFMILSAGLIILFFIIHITTYWKYIFTDFNGAVKTIGEVKDYIKKLCNESGIVWQEMGIYFTIKLFRIKPPSHVFTEEEIKEVLRAGNDFRNNRLVIDEEGYAHLIDSDLHYEYYRYPVSQESYDARNNYVGQYANLDDVSEIYLAMLDGWLHHLRTGQRYDVEYYEQCEDAEKMLAEIKQYYQ